MGAIEHPSGIAGINGIQRINVLQDFEEKGHTIPFLLALNLIEFLGMNIDTLSQWVVLQKFPLADGSPRISMIQRAPQSTHIEISKSRCVISVVRHYYIPSWYTG